jgi:hypothetical protein
MLKRIAAILASAASKVIGSLPTAGKWLDDIVSWPFRTLFGGGRDAPSYTPDIPAADYTDVLRNARETANVQTKKFDRNVLDSVLEYCRAHPDARDIMKLPQGLDPRIQATLLTMDDAALRALSRAGMSQIKRFVEGIPHSILGVPGFGEIRRVAANDAAPKMTPGDHVAWKVRASEKDAEPFTHKRVMGF